MNGIDFLADTNFMIHLNQGNKLVEPFLLYSFATSFITEIELLSAYNISKIKRKQFKELLDDCLILEMNHQIKKSSIEIRNQYKLKIPDAIIASTALVYNLPLISSDKEFEKIKDLNLIFLEKE